MDDAELIERFIKLQVIRQNASMSLRAMIGHFGAENVAGLLRILDAGVKCNHLYLANDEGWCLTPAAFLRARRDFGPELGLKSRPQAKKRKRANLRKIAAPLRSPVAAQQIQAEPDPDFGKPRKPFPKGGAMGAMAHMVAHGTIPEPAYVLSAHISGRFPLGGGCFRYMPRWCE